MFVPLSNFDLDDFDSDWFKYTLAANQDVFGLSKKARAQVRRDKTEEDWIRLDAWIKAEYQRLKNDPDVIALRHRRATLAALAKAAPGIDRIAWGGALELYPALKYLYDVGNENNTVATNLAGVLDYCHRQGIKPPREKVDTRVVREIEKLYKRSPCCVPPLKS